MQAITFIGMTKLHQENQYLYIKDTSNLHHMLCQLCKSLIIELDIFSSFVVERSFWNEKINYCILMCLFIYKHVYQYVGEQQGEIF